MKFKGLFIALAAAVASLLVACQKEKPVFGISVDKDVIEFTQSGGQAQVQVTTAQAWNVSIPADAQAWLSAEPTSGTGKAVVTFTAKANDGKDRKTGLKINAGMAGYVAITVSQPGSLKPGDGLTAATAWSASEANAWIKANLADKEVTSTKYYVKGIIHKVQTTFEASGNYGNAVFFISDDGKAASDDFEAYQVYYLGGRQWKKGDTEVKVGDEVILYGPVTLFGSTAETSGKGAAYIYSLNGVTDGGNVEPEDPTKVQQITCAEFISKADPNTTYRLVGKVTSDVNTKYCSFDMNDGTATVVVWTVNNASDWSSKVKKGGTVTVRGKYLRYENNGSVKHEMVDAYIEAFTEGSDQPAETVTGTVAQTIAANDGTNVVIPESTVMAISKQGIVVSDGTANVYLYFDAKNNETVPSVAIGDKVKVEAEKATYGGVPEFKAPKVTKLSSGGAVTYPEPKDLNPIAASYNSNVTEFVKMTGTLKISGNYVNLEMDGVDSNSKMGSVSAPLDALGASSFDGKKVTVKGYFSGITGSGKYINVVATEIVPADPDAKYCNVSPASISAKADDTSASFSISSNAAWTATSDNADFTLSPASGTGDATVTVSFAANSGDAPKVANITVACADAGVNATVTITQAKPSSGAGSSYVLDGEAIKAAHAEKWAYDSGAKSVTATDGSVWTLFNTYANTSQVTVQMNKGKGAYVLTPVLPSGKSVKKIAVVLNKKNDGTGDMGDRPMDILNADGTTTLLNNVTGQSLADGLEVPDGNAQVRIICDETDGGAVYITSITVFYE
jgi:hypothetical protein